MERFNNESEINIYNFVTESNQIMPNYDLDKKEVSIEVYLSPEKAVCMIGRKDNNYICWGSITNLNDKEKNKQIFNYIANAQFNIISTEYLALGYEKYNEIRNWYKCSLTRSTKKEMVWRTPFGHYYGKTNDKSIHGEFFTRDIIIFYEELLDKCNFRIQEGLYTPILRSYFETLTKEVSYNKVKPLISILERESYLRLSPDETVRELYLKCMKESSSLYNRYMDEVR